MKLWWDEEPGEEQRKVVRAQFERYLSDDRDRLTAYNAWHRMYTNREISGNSHLRGYVSAFTGGAHYSRCKLNVAKIIIDAVHSRVTRQSISVKFLTELGDPSKAKGARQMERFVQHKEHAGGVEKLTSLGYLDCEIAGTGVVRSSPHAREDDIDTTRVRACDVFVDPAIAAICQDPPDMFQRMNLPRHLVAKLYPEHEVQIKKAGRISSEPTNKRKPEDKSVIEVIEGWKLPSWKDAGDGRRILFIDGAVLDEGPWEQNTFPLTFTRWKDDPTVGFWGMGLCEELVGPHFNINASLYHTHKAVEMMPKPVAFLPAGSSIEEGQIGNVAGLMVKFVDGQPRIELPMSVPSDIVNLIQFEWGHALSIGRLAALGLPESTGGGFETGQALRDFNDIQSTELAPNFKEWQDFRVCVSESMISAGKTVADRAKAEGRQYKIVMAKDRNTIEEIDWDEISLNPAEDSYVIQALPTSSLSQTFAGKKADVIDMMNVGLIDQPTALTLLDFPDLDEFFSQIRASKRVIETDIESMLDDGVFIPFDPNEDLRLALKLYQSHISRAKTRKVPQERISLLEDAKGQILKYIEEEQQATRNAAMGIGGGLPGSPAALDLNGSSPQATTGPEQQQ